MKDGTLTICFPTLVRPVSNLITPNSIVQSPNVALVDEDTRVVDALGQAKLVDAGLKAALQEVLKLQGQHVIELHARLVEDANANQAADERIAFEQALRILLVQSEELT